MSFLQMSLAGGVMILVIALVRALTVDRLPKKTFLVLWGVALVRLLIPFSLPSGMSAYSLLARKFPAAGVSAAAFPAVTSGGALDTPVGTASPSAAAVSAWVIVWAAGALFCAAGFAAAYAKGCREFRTSLPVDNAVTCQWLETHPLRRTLSIRQSDHVSSPLTFGVLRPVILLPKTTDWKEAEALRFVLEHEFVHARRFDAVSKLVLTAAVCAHWLNPAVWLMYVLANRDMELVCDESVVRRFGAGARAAYANVLIDMEEAKSGLAPLGSYFSRNAIEERIKAIMKTRKTTVVSLVLAALLVAGTVTVFATSARAEAPAATESAEAVESGKGLPLSAEYRAAGIRRKGNARYYEGKPIAGICDDNGGIYLDDSAADGAYLHIRRNDENGIAGVSVITKAEFRELAERQMDRNGDADPVEGTLPTHAEPLTDAEYEAAETHR